MQSVSIFTCHNCQKYEPGPSSCHKFSIIIDAENKLCREHSSGTYLHLKKGTLYHREETLLGIELVPQRKMRQQDVIHYFFCKSCRKKLDEQAHQSTEDGERLLCREVAEWRQIPNFHLLLEYIAIDNGKSTLINPVDGNPIRLKLPIPCKKCESKLTTFAHVTLKEDPFQSQFMQILSLLFAQTVSK
jgi:hypothetical protein